MQLIYQDKKKRTIKNKEQIKFSSYSSYHLVIITARAKSEKQIGKKATDDEDLIAQIDEKTFPKLDSEKAVFDSPAAFNGGQLHNLAKIIYFLIYLEGKNHTITLSTDNPTNTATIISIEVYTLSLDNKLSLKINKQAEDGDRRPWITFVLDDLSLSVFSVTAVVKKRYRDSDDLKVVIDGKTQTHFEPEDGKLPDPFLKSWFYRFWYFVGSLLQTTVRIAWFRTELSKGLHYVELHADRMPKVENVEFEFKEAKKTSPTGKVALYKDLVSGDEAQLRREPQQKRDNILAILKNGEELEILEREVVGKYVRDIGYIWHKVRYKDIVGFIHSGLVELQGQSRAEIIKKIETVAKKYKINTSVAVALAGCESRFKAYSTSETWARGLFQITTIAKKEVARVYERRVEDLFNPDENIEVGILYYKLLWEGFYKDTPQALEKTVVAYNAGQSFVPPDLPLDYSRIPKENNQRQQAKNLAMCVLGHKDKKTGSLVKWTTILLFFIVLTSIFFSMARNLKPNSNTKSAILSADTFRNSKFTLEDTDSNLYFSVEEKWTKKNGFTTLVQVIDNAGNILEEKTLIGGLMNVYLYKHYLNFKPWLVVETGVGANGVLTYIYHFDEEMNLKLIPKITKGEKNEEPLGSRVFLYDDSNNGDSRLKLYLFQRTFSNSLYKDSIRIDYAYENEGFVEIE